MSNPPVDAAAELASLNQNQSQSGTPPPLTQHADESIPQPVEHESSDKNQSANEKDGADLIVKEAVPEPTEVLAPSRSSSLNALEGPVDETSSITQPIEGTSDGMAMCVSHTGGGDEAVEAASIDAKGGDDHSHHNDVAAPPSAASQQLRPATRAAIAVDTQKSLAASPSPSVLSQQDGPNDDDDLPLSHGQKRDSSHDEPTPQVPPRTAVAGGGSTAGMGSLDQEAIPTAMNESAQSEEALPQKTMKTKSAKVASVVVESSGKQKSTKPQQQPTTKASKPSLLPSITHGSKSKVITQQRDNDQHNRSQGAPVRPSNQKSASQHSNSQIVSVNPCPSPSNRTVSPVVLGGVALAAHEEARRSEATHAFWSNRLHLLRREVEAARIKAHMRRLEDDHHEASALANTTTASQLQAERQRLEAQREERAEAIRQQREERRTTFRALLCSTVASRIEAGRQQREQAQQQRSMVQQLRDEVLGHKKDQRDRVITEKEKAVERRRREKALREEKARLLYEVKVNHLDSETVRKNEETRALVEESGKLLEQLRRLQNLDKAKDGTVTSRQIEEAVADV